MYISPKNMPYFMKNTNWYELKEEDGRRFYAPTENAPKKAIRSIERFNAEHTGIDDNGHAWADF